MIFALMDYFAYTRRAGRFSRDIRRSVMGGAFEGEIPAHAIDLLLPGDVLLIQTLDSLLSWMVMYLTTSEVSHTASYLGNGEIIHSTLGGVCVGPVDSLFDQNTRVLPTQWNIPDDQRSKMAESLRSNLGRPYGWAAVVIKAIRIISGRDWPYFRWRFAADVALILLVLDVPAVLILQQPVLAWLLPVYFLLILFHWLLWKIKPLGFSEWTGKPCDMLTIIQESGGTFVFDAFQLAQQTRERPRENP